MGAIINAILVLIGSAIGLIANRGIPERVSETVQTGLGFVVIIMGIEGALSSSNTLFLIISIALGAIIGEGFQLEQKIHQGVRNIESRFSKSSESNLAEGFIAATSLFCVGSMVIIGSLENGLQGDPTTLITKGVIDGISAVFLAASYGFGVTLSAGAVLVIEGLLILFAGFLQPILSDLVIAEVVAVGSLLLIGLGLNMTGLSNFKIMNYTPAMLVPIILVPLFEALPF